MAQASTKWTAAALATISVVAEPGLRLNCANAEAKFAERPVTCTRVLIEDFERFRQPCSSLAELYFPPHAHSGGAGSDEPTTSAPITASGNVSNVSVGMVSFTSYSTKRA